MYRWPGFTLELACKRWSSPKPLIAVGPSLLPQVHCAHQEPVLVQHGGTSGTSSQWSGYVKAAKCRKDPSSFLSAAPLQLPFFLHTHPIVLGPKQQVLHTLPALQFYLTLF